MSKPISRSDLFALLGDLPPRPRLPPAQTADVTPSPGYLRQDFTLDNGYDSHIPAVMLTPTHTEPPYPAVLYLHAHGHRYQIGKSELFAPRADGFIPAADLTAAGYAVLCADAYAFGARQHPDEITRFKAFLWEGKTLWGMMLRDDLIALDYLCAHPHIDAERVGAIGMSMGSTRAWWLAALDDRVAVTVAIACLPRYADLAAANAYAAHSIYFYLPAIRQHTDTEHILSHIAPRPLLALTGDQDPTSPLSGVKTIEAHLRRIYARHSAPGHFHNIIYPNTGHTFSAAMWQETLGWLAHHL